MAALAGLVLTLEKAGKWLLLFVALENVMHISVCAVCNRDYFISSHILLRIALRCSLNLRFVVVFSDKKGNSRCLIQPLPHSVADATVNIPSA